MRIMLCQTQIVWENKQANLERLRSLLEIAKSFQVSLLCLPEMSFTGFSMNLEKTMDKQQETMQAVQALAVKAGIAVAFGYVSPDSQNQKAYNHYACVDKNGVVLGDYIKIHPFSYGGENQYFTAGQELVHFDFQDFHIGLSICYDLRFPEQFTKLGDVCDLILVAANWPEERSLHWRTLLRARAIENQCYVAGINCVGRMNQVSYRGDTMLIGPDGADASNVLYPTGTDYKIWEIDNHVDAIRQAFPVRQDRKCL